MSPWATPPYTEFRYDLAGDANLDGVVNVADLLTVLRNYNVTSSLWSDGNFQFGSSTVNVADLLDVLRNYNVSVSGSGMVSRQSGVTCGPGTGQRGGFQHRTGD